MRFAPYRQLRYEPNRSNRERCLLRTPRAALPGLIYLVLISSVAALGGLLFGYDAAVISGAIGLLQSHFSLSSAGAGWAASSALVGCVLGTAAAGLGGGWAYNSVVCRVSHCRRTRPTSSRSAGRVSRHCLMKPFEGRVRGRQQSRRLNAHLLHAADKICRARVDRQKPSSLENQFRENPG